MAEVVQFKEYQGPAVGSYIKALRHGESLWLQVKQVRPSDKTIIAQLANAPLMWPYSLGDAVRIRFDEVIDWLPEEAADG